MDDSTAIDRLREALETLRRSSGTTMETERTRSRTRTAIRALPRRLEDGRDA